MNPNTGAIASFETSEDAKRAGHTLALSDRNARRLLQKTREQRLASIDMLRERAAAKGHKFLP